MTQHRRHQRNLILVTLFGASLAIVSACSSSTTAPSGSAKPSNSASAAVGASSFGLKPDPKVVSLIPSSIKSKQPLVNAFYNNSPPNDIVKDGKLIGVQVDFSKAVSEVMGHEFNNVIQGNFSTIIPALHGGRYDLSFSGVGITQAREQVVDIVSFYQVGIQFAVNPNKPKTIGSADDLCGLNVGELAGSQYVAVTKQLSSRCTKMGKKAISIQQFPTDSDAILALQNNRVDAYGQTSINVEYEAKEAGLKVEPFVYDKTPQGVAVAKGSPLGKVLQAALRSLIDSGTYAKILAKWHVPGMAVPASQVVINPTVSD